jgi:hypothetical protein
MEGLPEQAREEGRRCGRRPPASGSMVGWMAVAAIRWIVSETVNGTVTGINLQRHQRCNEKLQTCLVHKGKRI